jgi:hypothetical protein
MISWPALSFTGEARAEYVIEGARVEQRCPSSKFSELVVVCGGYSFD